MKISKLRNGETITTSEKGNSMTPIIKSGQKHILEPVSLEQVSKGDVVFCKVNGRYYTHLVTAVGERGVQISNNQGHVNGWTKIVFGRLVRVLGT